MRVPEWLDHLRTDRVGRPVPMVNRWGLEEKPELVNIGYDRLVGGLAVFYDDSAEAAPDFSTQHIARQRESVLAGRCQVCWREVPWSRRFLVVSTVSTHTVTSPGERTGALTVREPWLCQRCGEFAVGVCPALIRRRSADDLQLVKITSKRDVEILVGTGSVDGFEETFQGRVAMWASILIKQRVFAG